MARNRVIGRDNGIPWHLPNELQLFKRITMGHHIVMGRRTWESIGRLLPGRTTVIVTRQLDYVAPGAVVVPSLEAAIAACGDDPDIFVIGGAQLYQSALPMTDRIYLTVVDAEIDGDTRMPELDISRWRETESQSFPADERHAHPYRLSLLERI
jgi:dihydrofolate reductase